MLTLMKLVLLLEKGFSLAKRVGKGVKDIKQLHKAVKANKADATDVPEGQIDNARLLGLITAVASLVAGVLYAFGKIDPEVYAKLMEVLN